VSIGLLEFLNARLDEDAARAWAVHDVEKCDALLYEEDMAGAVAGTPECDCGRPARALRFDLAERAGIAAITAEPHEYIPGDEFYSCSQAVDPHEEDPAERYPGSGCSDDGRAGRPCDCGRDARVKRLLRILAAVYSDHPDYDPGWKP